MLPQRFSLTYINKKGKEETPVLIHRAPLGSIERFMGILIEHYAGSFPLWLSPIQVKVLPINTRNEKYAEEIFQTLLNQSIRVEIDKEKQTLSYKVRKAETEKVPYVLIIGDKEEKEKTISVRSRKDKKVNKEKLDNFIKRIKEEIEKRS